jgi:3-oxoacyl-[acyl-carrier protein] reductase
MIDPKLKGKIVLITGANHGIGAAATRAFAAQGAKVFITYFRENCNVSKEELEKAIKSGVGGKELYWAMQQLSGDIVMDEIRTQGGR